MKIKKFYSTLLIFSLLFFTTGCGERERELNCFPYEVISFQLDLNLAAYHKLNNVGEWIYVNGAGAGTNGLIVIRASNTTFKIYDRNAPHLCPSGTETILKVEDNIKIICPKDGAEWILLTGQPTKISNVPPKTYRYDYNPNVKVLSIYN